MARRLILPAIHPLMATATITRLHAAPGALVAGTALLDVGINLADALGHDCPPISHYRLVLREPAWLDAWHVGVGDAAGPSAVLATFDGAGGASEPRPLRVMVAGIVPDHGWWTTA